MSNTCECPKPPGGRVFCESNQMALCIVKNGEVTQRCLNPDNTSNHRELVIWAISKITDSTRTSDIAFERKELKMLLGGSYDNSEFRATFSLPPRVLIAVQELIDKDELINQLKMYKDYGELPINSISNKYDTLKNGEYILARIVKIPKKHKSQKALTAIIGGSSLKRGSWKIFPKNNVPNFESLKNNVSLFKLVK